MYKLPMSTGELPQMTTADDVTQKTRLQFLLIFVTRSRIEIKQPKRLVVKHMLTK